MDDIKGDIEQQNVTEPEAVEATAEQPEAEAVAATGETAEQPEAAAEAEAEEGSEEAVPEEGKKKRKMPAFLRKIIDYLNAHEDIRQMVLFFLFSMICGATQLILTYALSAGLRLVGPLTKDFDWFIFKYDTIAEFIGFLVGSVVGQVLTFVLNRKKTFNSTDYVALRAVMYAIMAVLIILMQVYLGGLITKACWDAKPDANDFLGLLFNLTGQAVAGIAALIINFLGNKFFIMRDWGGKKKKAALEAAAAEEAQAEVPAEGEEAQE